MSSQADGYEWEDFCNYFADWRQQMQDCQDVRVNMMMTNNNKAIIDHTSPALCTPITPFLADME